MKGEGGEGRGKEGNSGIEDKRKMQMNSGQLLNDSEFFFSSWALSLIVKAVIYVATYPDVIYTISRRIIQYITWSTYASQR